MEMIIIVTISKDKINSNRIIDFSGLLLFSLVFKFGWSHSPETG